MKIRNLTPHDITLVLPDSTITIPAERPPARVLMNRYRVDTLALNDEASVDVWYAEPREVVDLPPFERGTLLIVSRYVAEQCRDRPDLLIVEDTVRDEQGRVVAARALATLNARAYDLTKVLAEMRRGGRYFKMGRPAQRSWDDLSPQQQAAAYAFAKARHAGKSCRESVRLAQEAFVATPGVGLPPRTAKTFLNYMRFMQEAQK